MVTIHGRTACTPEERTALIGWLCRSQQRRVAEAVMDGADVTKGTVQGLDEIGRIRTRWKILGGRQASDGGRLPVRDVMEALGSSAGTAEDRCERAAIRAKIDGIMRQIDANRHIPRAAALERGASLVLCGGSAQVVALHAFSSARNLVNAELWLCIVGPRSADAGRAP